MTQIKQLNFLEDMENNSMNNPPPAHGFNPPTNDDLIQEDVLLILKKLPFHIDKPTLPQMYENYCPDAWDSAKVILRKEQPEIYQKLVDWETQNFPDKNIDSEILTDQKQNFEMEKIDENLRKQKTNVDLNEKNFNEKVLEWESENNPFFKSILAQEILTLADKLKLSIKREKHIQEYIEKLKDYQTVEDQDVDNMLTPWLVSENWLTDVPKQDWLIPNLIPKGYGGCVSGQVGSGKSTLGTQASISVALGGELFGEKVQKGIVIYCCSDEGKDLLKRRLKEQGLPASAINQSFFPLVTDVQGNYWDVTKLAILEALLKKITNSNPMTPILIVMDSMTSLVSEPTGNDLVSEGINKELGKIIKLSRRFNSTLLFITHSRNDGTKPFGIVEKLMDFTWLMNRGEGNKTVLIKRKGRDMDKVPYEKYLCFDIDTKLFSVDDNPRQDEWLSECDQNVYEIIKSNYEQHNKAITRSDILKQYKERHDLEIESEYPKSIGKLRDQGLIQQIGKTKGSGWLPTPCDNDESCEPNVVSYDSQELINLKNP